MPESLCSLRKSRLRTIVLRKMLYEIPARAKVRELQVYPLYRQDAVVHLSLHLYPLHYLVLYNPTSSYYPSLSLPFFPTWSASVFLLYGPYRSTPPFHEDMARAGEQAPGSSASPLPSPSPDRPDHASEWGASGVGSSGPQPTGEHSRPACGWTWDRRTSLP